MHQLTAPVYLMSPDSSVVLQFGPFSDRLCEHFWNSIVLQAQRSQANNNGTFAKEKFLHSNGIAARSVQFLDKSKSSLSSCLSKEDLTVSMRADPMAQPGYCLATFHARSIHEIDSSMGGWNEGLALASTSIECEDSLESVRFAVEGCDRLDSFVASMDGAGFWGGYACGMLTVIRDEFEKNSMDILCPFISLENNNNGFQNQFLLASPTEKAQILTLLREEIDGCLLPCLMDDTVSVNPSIYFELGTLLDTFYSKQLYRDVSFEGHLNSILECHYSIFSEADQLYKKNMTFPSIPVNPMLRPMVSISRSSDPLTSAMPADWTFYRRPVIFADVHSGTPATVSSYLDLYGLPSAASTHYANMRLIPAIKGSLDISSVERAELTEHVINMLTFQTN